MGGTKDTVKTDKNETSEKNGAAVYTAPGKATAKKTDDSVYTVQELAYNAKALFNTMPECVTAALKMAGLTSCTVEEAKVLVKNFLNQEVD